MDFIDSVDPFGRCPRLTNPARLEHPGSECVFVDMDPEGAPNVPIVSHLPGTAERVELHTPPHVNERIYHDMRRRVAECYALSDEEIDARIRELEQEWDIERTLEANAASVILAGLALGTFAHRRWYLLSAAAAGFLLQHAVQGWCPPLPLFRRRGIRTAREIHEEITALRALRGDFGEPEDIEAALDRAIVH